MNLLEKVAMKQAISRLQASGVAPRGETAVDFDTAALPGNARNAPILLLTASALYGGYTGRPDGKRLALGDIGRILIEESRRAVSYRVIDADGDQWCNLEFMAPRPSFKGHMARLDPGPQRLPGLSIPLELFLTQPVLASLTGRLLRLKREGRIETMNHLATLNSTARGLGCVSAPGGLVWRSDWSDVEAAYLAEGDSTRPGGVALLELVNGGGEHALMALPPLALLLSQPRPTDEFLLHESVEPYLAPERYQPSVTRGADLLDSL